MSKQKKKSEIKGGFLSFLAGFILLLVIAVFAADKLGIFSIEDLKSLISPGSTTVSNDLTVHFINVGQGDSSLIISEGEAMLIDTGEKEYSDTVLEYMEEQGVKKLDYLVLSHPHSDHMGGAANIINGIEVENVIAPRVSDKMTPDTKVYEKFLDAVEDNGLKITKAVPGDKYEVGQAEAEILSPVEDDYSDLNDWSAAVLLKHGEDSFLFTGDITSKVENDIIKDGRLERIDVLKVAHHGSKTSSGKKFLELVSPEYGVIMCDGTSYNHPNDEIVKRLEKYGVKIYRTDLNGTVVFTSGKNGLSVKAER